MKKEDLLKKIGLVPQKAVLFKGTIRENLLWGNPNATEEMMWKALEIAQAKEFGHSARREVGYLTIHSVLHLLGYDHLDEGPQKAQMRAREEEIVGGIPRMQRD